MFAREKYIKWNIVPEGFHEKSFRRPNTLAPVAQVYRMFSKVGLPRGHAAHFHPTTVEVCFVLRGRLDWWAGDAIYEVHAGDVVVIPVGVPHGSIDSTLQPCEYYAVHLNPADLSPSIAATLSDTSMAGLHSSQSELGQLVIRIFQEHEQPDSCSQDTCQALCSLLIASLARHKRLSADRRVSKFVHLAQEALLASLEADSPVAMAAENLRVSTAWLNRKFREEVGQAPGEWIRNRKIVEAKQLLAFGRSSPTEVSIRLGFKSTQYFATAFKREIGLSPSAYRNLFWVSPGRRRFSDPVSAEI